jgi:hypothetical protein
MSFNASQKLARRFHKILHIKENVMLSRSEKYCFHRDTCKNHLSASCPVDCWQYQTYHNVLCDRALALGDDALTDKEQAYIYGAITLEQLQDPELKVR